MGKYGVLDGSCKSVRISRVLNTMLSKFIHLIIGPALFMLCLFCLPASVFESVESRAAIGTVLWMAYWWVMRPVDYAITAFLPMVVNAILPMTGMAPVIANYASETVLLLFGASIITVSWEETGLDRRIASVFLRVIGDNLRTQLVFWFLLSAVLSAVLPNSVVCATITPIAVAMLKYVGQGDIENSKIGSSLLLTIAYAAGVGGLATPLGGAMNLVTVDYIQQVTGEEYMYVDWIVRFMPIMAILIISNILFLLVGTDRKDLLGGSRKYFEKEYGKLPVLSKVEWASLILFVVALLLSFTRQFYKDILPGLKPAYSFVICGLLCFLINKSDGKRLMVWKSVQGKIIWELLFIFAGGMAVGTLITGSGAAKAIGDYVAQIGLSGGIIAVCVFIAVPMFMANVTSNTGAASVVIPIVISIVGGLGQNPIPYIYAATIGVNLAYMIPTSIRAIPVGYGLSAQYMLKVGWKITVMTLILMTISGYLLMTYWPAFSK